MGTSTSSAQLVGKIRRFGTEFESLNAASVAAAAQAVKDVTEPKVRRATGGDGRLSGVGRNGARIGVRYDVKGTVNATALVKATGPAHLVESDTKPHVVASRYGPKRTRRARSSMVAAGKTVGAGWDRRAVISFGGVTVRYAVESGGSKGRHPYRDGFAAGSKMAPKAYASRQRQAFVKVFS